MSHQFDDLPDEVVASPSKAPLDLMLRAPSTIAILPSFALIMTPLVAVEITTNFNNGSTQVPLPDGLQSSTTLGGNTPTPFTFIYNIASLSLGDATTIHVTASSNGTNFNSGGGNGIAVVGGNNNSWWEENDGPLNFVVSIKDPSNNDITDNFTVDLTGASIRWTDTTPASATLSIASSGPFNQSSVNQAFDLPTGQTSETSFIVSRTANTIGQFQQLRFEIGLANDTTPPSITSTNPVDNSTNFPTSANLSLSFSEEINLSGTGTINILNLDNNSFETLNLPTTNVSKTSPNRITITPPNNLLPDTNYALQISGDSIQDLSNNSFVGIADDTTWNFKTQPTTLTPSAPNVIVYLLDDLGLTDVQQHPTFFPDGSPLFETPNIHRLASEGMRFNHAYAQPLCSASRAALLSGQDAARNALHLAIVRGSVPNPALPSSSGVSRSHNWPTDRDHMPLEVETIAERLKEAGYATWHVGKWHLTPASNGSNPNPASTYYPDKQGFDLQLSIGGPGPSSYFGPFGGIPNMVDHLGNPALGSTGDHLPDHMAQLTKNMISHHLATDPTRPFFLYYPSYSVHGPHQAKQSLFNYYQTKLNSLPNSKHKHPVLAAQVHSADHELGLMLDFLENTTLANNTTLADNTILIFLSDNGGLSITLQSGTLFDDIGPDGIPDDQPGNVTNGSYASSTAPIPATTRLSDMSPRRAGKGSLYEGGIRIPMIVKFPGHIAPASASNEPVHLTDVYQTILDYTPATPKENYPLDGVSLKPILEQTGNLPDRNLFLHFPRVNTTWGTKFINENFPGIDYPFDKFPGGTAVINHPFKMIARYSTAHDAVTVDYELFRIDTDLGEDNNIAAEFPQVVDEMRKSLQNFYTNTGALVPSPNPNYDGAAFDSPEVQLIDYLTNAGLTPNTPQTFLLTDPDSDGRTNQDEFLQITDPNSNDQSFDNIWLTNNDTFDELRFAIPANILQNTVQVTDQSTNTTLTPGSGLILDAQYGDFYIYRPSNPQPNQQPNNFEISIIPPTPPPPTTQDTDGDLLPDSFESENGLNPNDPSDGNADNDNDNFTRGQEFVFGSSDFDSEAFPKLTIIKNNETSSLSFPIQDQKHYRLRQSNDLINWRIIEDFGIITGNHQVTLPLNLLQSQEFFSLEVTLP